ncbi:hypothetical protein ACOTVP_08695 [Aliarcobacter butzleri]
MQEELERLRKIELNIKKRIATLEKDLSEIKTNENFNQSDKVQTICILREIIEEIKSDLI